MDKNTLSNKWDTIKSQVKQKFNKLTDEDVTQIAGKRDVLLSKIQQRYGYDAQKAERELNTFESSCGCSHGGTCASSERETVNANAGHAQRQQGNQRPNTGTTPGSNKNKNR